jgi:pimeloyl-ACP methyl ester carboxylesterase
MNRLTCSLLIVSTILLIAAARAGAVELLALDSPRAGVKLKLLLDKPEKPDAVLVMLPGGLGNVGVASVSGSAGVGKELQGNFLVRTRDEYVKKGLAVAILDTPSDRPDGMPVPFRMSKAHAQDLIAVVEALKQRLAVPVWLVGTSRGTISVARGLVEESPQVSGAVLTSSILQAGEKWPIRGSHPNVLLNMPLENVTVPVLIVHHRKDACEETPPARVEDLKGKFKKARTVELKWIEGGLPPKSDPCQALSAHGFYGVEGEAVLSIVDFVKANSK